MGSRWDVFPILQPTSLQVSAYFISVLGVYGAKFTSKPTFEYCFLFKIKFSGNESLFSPLHTIKHCMRTSHVKLKAQSRKLPNPPLGLFPSCLFAASCNSPPTNGCLRSVQGLRLLGRRKCAAYFVVFDPIIIIVQCIRARSPTQRISLRDRSERPLVAGRPRSPCQEFLAHQRKQLCTCTGAAVDWHISLCLSSDISRFPTCSPQNFTVYLHMSNSILLLMFTVRKVDNLPLHSA